MIKAKIAALLAAAKASLPDSTDGYGVLDWRFSKGLEKIMTLPESQQLKALQELIFDELPSKEENYSWRQQQLSAALKASFENEA